VAEVQSTLMTTVGEFADAPDLTHKFARAFAALELMDLLAKHGGGVPPVPGAVQRWRQLFLATLDREIAAYTTDKGFQKDLSGQLDRALASLLARATDFHRGVPGTPSSALSRKLELAGRSQGQDFLFDPAELVRWVAPYGEDVARVWSDCRRAEHMLAIAQAMGIGASELGAIVADLVLPALTALPGDGPLADDALGLERWSTAAVETRLPAAALAGAGAHLARARTGSERNHPGTRAA
jgi:hypothetical protein